MSPGIHLVHKPIGPSSFSLVRACLESRQGDQGKRGPRICHGGTLDPFACGLLLILVEPATRLFDYLHAIPKIYDATIRWGVETDNGDLLGQPTFTGDASNLAPRQLDEALATFAGWRDQVPPATSAKRIDGERAYVKAHRGEAVNLPPSQVYLHEARWLEHDLPRQSKLRVTVRGGFYVRSLARDLGRLLGCGAHLTELNRTAIGPWSDPGPDRRFEIHGRDILPWAGTRILSDLEVGDLRQGRSIANENIIPPDWALPKGFPNSQAPIRGFHQQRFCFLLSPDAGRLNLVRPLPGGL